ncbi:MAG: MBOAT family protein, partial [Tagaea sp.]|nr:MBOAT family protein [Tagaea sp.]
IPLGGDTGTRRVYVNLALVMLLGGLWHGAAWQFVVWGALHGAALIAARAVPVSMPRALAIFLTFHFVCATWVFFRAPDLATALDYFAGLGRFGWPEHAGVFVVALIAAGLASQFLSKDRLVRAEALVVRWPAWAQGAALGAAIVAIDAIGPKGIAPFIYFQF